MPRRLERGTTSIRTFDCSLPILYQVNVLVDASERALLCDFGLAQVKADVTSRSNHMGEKGAIGSRNWMAPELLTGSPVKQSSDVYAFGMTVYEVRNIILRLTY